MELESKRAQARQQCIESGIAVLPYGDAWWLLGAGVNRVIGELAGFSPQSLVRFGVTPR